MYCIADGSYTKVFTVNRTFVSSKKLKEFELMLPATMFYRIHHGHLINMGYITNMQKANGNIVVMKDGKELEIAVRRKDDFMKAFVR
jgi:two-component system LytT family response regulator